MVLYIPFRKSQESVGTKVSCDICTAKTVKLCFYSGLFRNWDQEAKITAYQNASVDGQ